MLDNVVINCLKIATCDCLGLGAMLEWFKQVVCIFECRLGIYTTILYTRQVITCLL